MFSKKTPIQPSLVCNIKQIKNTKNLLFLGALEELDNESYTNYTKNRFFKNKYILVKFKKIIPFILLVSLFVLLYNSFSAYIYPSKTHAVNNQIKPIKNNDLIQEKHQYLASASVVSAINNKLAKEPATVLSTKNNPDTISKIISNSNNTNEKSNVNADIIAKTKIFSTPLNSKNKTHAVNKRKYKISNRKNNLYKIHKAGLPIVKTAKTTKTNVIKNNNVKSLDTSLTLNDAEMELLMIMIKNQQKPVPEIKK